MRERNKIQRCVVIHNAWPNHKITVHRKNQTMYQIKHDQTGLLRPMTKENLFVQPLNDEISPDRWLAAPQAWREKRRYVLDADFQHRCGNLFFDTNCDSLPFLGNARIHRASRPPALRMKNNPGGYRQGPLEYSDSVTRTRQNNFQILQEEEQP